MRYEWPGNIRELENTIERAVILCPGEQITAGELPAHLLPEGEAIPFSTAIDSGFSLRDMEREFIRTILAQTEGNKSRAAKLLGIARQTLLNKIREYKL